MSKGHVFKYTNDPTRADSVARAMVVADAVTFAGTVDVAIASLLHYGRAPTGPTDGARLKRARERAGLGQGRLAKSLGYEHRSSVGNIEIGRAPLVGAARAWVEAQEASS